MSYRTRVNGRQIFGNNDYYIDWIDFIKTQGIDVDDEGNYKGYITDVNKAISVIEGIVFALYQDVPSIFDMTPSVKFWMVRNDDSGEGLLDANFAIINNSYLFLPFIFVEACGENITEKNGEMDSRLHQYELAENGKVYVEAY